MSDNEKKKYYSEIEIDLNYYGCTAIEDKCNF
jgi:hypothetical protein